MKKKKPGLKQRIYEMVGRQNNYQPPTFLDSELLTPLYELKVDISQRFVPSFPSVTAIVYHSDGNVTAEETGYTELPWGRYGVRYVDRKRKFLTLPTVEEQTIDGAWLKIDASVTYAVADPLLLLTIDNPLEALQQTSTSAIKRVIHRHYHDDLIGSAENNLTLPTDDLPMEISLDISQQEACKAFSIFTVKILNIRGNAEFLALRQQRALQHNKTIVEQENVHHKQLLAGEENELGRIKARGHNVLEEIKAQGDGVAKVISAKYEAKKEFELSDAKRLMNELEIARKKPEYQHETKLKQIDAAIKTLETMVQALTRPGAQRGGDDSKLLDELSHVLHSDIEGELPANEEKPTERKASTDNDDDFIHLLIPKKK